VRVCSCHPAPCLPRPHPQDPPLLLPRRYMGKGVSKAVDNVNTIIAPALLVRT
jgi:hypothetical protein